VGFLADICNVECIPSAATSLCARWKKICLTKSEHVEDFELIDDNASAEDRRSWQESVEHADMTRQDDVSVMDIYNVKLPNGMPLVNEVAGGLTQLQ
jgi:hypothetical protein